MAFRDDLEAARQQIDALEARLRDQERAARQREDQLRGQIRALEQRLGRTREMAEGRLRLTCWAPSALVLALYVAGVLLAISDLDSAAWSANQLAILAGVLGTGYSWGAIGRLGPWAGLALLKAGVVVLWGWGWWHPFYGGLSNPSFGTPLYFFWVAPVVVLTIAVLEGFLVRSKLRPVTTRP